MRFQPAFFLLAASLFTGIQASNKPFDSLEDSQLELLTELGKRYLEARGYSSESPQFSDHVRKPSIWFNRPSDLSPGHREEGMMYAGGTPGFYSPGGPGYSTPRSKRALNDDEDSDDEDDDEDVEARDLPESNQLQFQSAIRLVKALKNNLSESDRISLWGLYQQATLGNINVAKENAKLEAWKSRANMSKEEAQRKFRGVASELYKNATTPVTTKSAATTVTVTHVAAVPTVAPSTKQLWNMYTIPQNFGEPEFTASNKKAEELHEKFDEGEKLKLYGLYKQSILGDNRVERVEDAGKELGGYKPKERWESWQGLKGKAKVDARREYVEFVKVLEEKHKNK